jgi:hypothetical protein
MTSNLLPVLAADINESHALAVQHAGDAVNFAIRCGELLAEAKGKVSHGQWLPWLRQNIGFSERTAQAYMRIALRLERQMRNGVADLSVRNVLRELSTPQRLSRDDDLSAWLERRQRARAEAADDPKDWTLEHARACATRIRELDEMLHRHRVCHEDNCLACDAKRH